MSEDVLTVDVHWLDGKKIQASARGNELLVDKIYEDGREGMGFRPTELILAGLGACTMGNVLVFCENMNIPIESFSIQVRGKREKSPERIGEISVEMELSGDIPDDRIETLHRVAKGCRIHYTLALSPKIEVDLKVRQHPGVEKKV